MYVIARKIGLENKQSNYEQEIAKTEVSGQTTKYFMHPEIFDKIGRENKQSKYELEIVSGKTTKCFMHAEIFDISCYLDNDKIGRE